jgi:S1-C subfamily serine protease
VLQLLDPIRGLKPLRLAEVRVADVPGGPKANVVRGSWAIVLGHPNAAGVGDGSASASWGILSSVRRKAPGPARALYHYSILLETDARIAVGSSGGVLLNLAGEAIGLITPLAAVTGSETAGGFAIPFDANYQRIIEVLRSGREVEYGFLGVSVEPTSSRYVEGGLRIRTVSPHTPAALAQLRGTENGGRDRLVAIDGIPIREQDDLFLLIGAALAGTRVTLTVAREGRTDQVPVTLAKSPNEMPWLASTRSPAVHGLRVDYGSILLLQNLALPRRIEPVIPAGVLVREVEPNSPADAWFKKLGGGVGRWLVTHVNDKPVQTPAEFYREAAVSPASVVLRLIDPNTPGDAQIIRLPDPPPPDRSP